jgi:hypothetical protein
MEQLSLAYAKYWRICLADADLGKGALNRSELEKLILRPNSEIQNGRVDAELTQEFFKHSGQDVEEVEVTIRPYIYHSRFEHGRARTGGIPEVVTPIVSQAVILPLFAVLHSNPIMRTFCLAAVPRTSVAQTSLG